MCWLKNPTTSRQPPFNGAGIDREAHGRRRHIVMLCQRGKDRLRRKQIDHGKEGRQADDERTQRTPGNDRALPCFRTSSRRICRSMRAFLQKLD